MPVNRDRSDFQASLAIRAISPARKRQLEADGRRCWFRAHGVLSRSSRMDSVFEIAERVARSDASVLLEGETGTGKELIARAVHILSGRTNYVALNCAALADGLLESELFGHERGPFTGADRSRAGLVAQASGGTLFLDEVCEMTAAAQAKLLRVLQEKEVRPIGGTTTRRVDVRVIAATNVAMRDACASGRFREDLYHRLAVVPIALPPLRERAGDVPLLISHFLQSRSPHEGKRAIRIDGDALRILEDYRWPGNVRELQNEIQRIVVCARDGDIVRRASLSPWIAQQPENAPVDRRPLREVMREFEAATISARLRQNNYHRTATARSLGISREALWSKLRNMGLDATGARGSRAAGTKTANGSAVASAGLRAIASRDSTVERE